MPLSNRDSFVRVYMLREKNMLKKKDVFDRPELLEIKILSNTNKFFFQKMLQFVVLLAHRKCFEAAPLFY
jgi:hypothetical protein